MKVKQDKKVWEQQYDSGEWDWLSSHSEFAHYSMVAAYLGIRNRPISLLDLGCGEGIMLQYLRPDLISEYTGVDIAQSALNKIQPSRPSDQLICSPLEAYHPKRTWDVILFNEVLYYCSHDPIGLLSRFESCLEPEGCMVISMYQKPNPFCLNNRCYRKVSRHVQKAGYKVIDRVEINNGARWKILVYSTQPLHP